MDPVSIGLTVAAVLAAKAGEGFAQQIGADSWGAVQRLYARIRERLSPTGTEALERLDAGDDDHSAVALVAGEVRDAAEKDAAFRAEVERLLSEASKSAPVVTILAQARDDAKQINFAGDNTGTINMG
ncbi:hypothetical protein [Streptosporangium sp. NPDC051022]|uniref:hypothetical protein n=1 Tax=Streptosporangium sp. NPDC051022 TaxID=3155752 RepID=UPI003443D095